MANRKPPECNHVCCKTPDEAVAKIKADLERWRPGLWAEEVNYGPANSEKKKVDLGPKDEPFSMFTE